MIEWIHPQVGVGQLTNSQVLNLQIQMNLDNIGIGSPRASIAEDGIAGPQTCQLAQYLNTRTGEQWLPEFQGMAPGRTPTVLNYPASTLCEMAAARAQPAPSPPTEEPEETVLLQPRPFSPLTPDDKKKGKVNWGLALLGAGVIGLGVFALRGIEL